MNTRQTLVGGRAVGNEPAMPEASAARLPLRLPVSRAIVPNPERWWLATADLMPWRTDPELDGGRPFHRDRLEIRWRLLARVLTEIAGRLQRGEYTASRELPNAVDVPFAPPVGGFSVLEITILDSWFVPGDAPRADPWHTELVDGRYRIWNVWAYDSTAWLPIRSPLLDATDEVAAGGPFLAASIRERAAYGRRMLPTIVARRSPQYTSALEAAQKITTRSAPGATR